MIRKLHINEEYVDSPNQVVNEAIDEFVKFLKDKDIIVDDVNYSNKAIYINDINKAERATDYLKFDCYPTRQLGVMVYCPRLKGNIEKVIPDRTFMDENTNRKYNSRRYIKEDAFESRIASNPTWQQVNRICNEYGYQLDPYARVEVYKNGRRSLENVDISPINLQESETMPSIVVYGDNEFAVTILDSPIYESSIVEYNAYVETLADVSKMLEDLKGIDFYTLHNEPLGE
jgi:hypothetical protein